MKPTILINLDRCTGCWSCSIACKVGNQLADDEWWQFVRTMGSGEGIDWPGGKWPNLWMSWLPVHTEDCTLCSERTSEGMEPYCVYNCPNLAMNYGDSEDPESPLSKSIAELKAQGYRIFQLPKWERSRPEIWYAEK